MNKLHIGIMAVLVAVVIGLGVSLHQANRGDINHDGKVNALDLSIIAKHWTGPTPVLSQP